MLPAELYICSEPALYLKHKSAQAIPEYNFTLTCVPDFMRTALSLLRFCLVLLASTAMLSSCVTSAATRGANAIQTPYAATKTYKTYAWHQPTPSATPVFEKGYSEKLDKNIIRAVEEELEKHGYRKTTESPDVLVAYDISVSMVEEMDKAAKTRPGFGYSYGYMVGYRYNYGHADMPGYRAVDLFKQGTLIIDLINPKSNMLLWRGWAEGGITNFKASYSKVHNQVEEVLSKL